MKFRKTHKSDRGTYTYEVESLTEAQVTKKVTIIPGRDGVTEYDIKLLHSIDDATVENNINNHRREKSEKQKKEEKEWIENFQLDFEKQHGYRLNQSDISFYLENRFPAGWFLSIEHQQELYEDKSSILMDVSDDPEVITPIDEFCVSKEPTEDGDLQAFFSDFAKTLPKSKKFVFENVLLGDMKKKDAAAILGLSDVRVSQISKELLKQIIEIFSKKITS